MRAILQTLIDRYASRDGLPPRQLQEFIGGGDFRAVGEEFRGYLIGDLGLRPDARVLDVGCGCGRMALPLTEYLSPSGSYEGFDIMPRLVKWCRNTITPRHPNFQFQLADVHNPVYHPAGRKKPDNFGFPFESESFDCVFLTSVFTHMLPRGVERYLFEIARVLKPAGRTLITFFLLNDESRSLISQGRSSLAFLHKFESCLVTEPRAPEAAIAYPERTVRNLYQEIGLNIIEPVLYGNWCGRASSRSYQDIVLATRAGRAAARRPRAA